MANKTKYDSSLCAKVIDFMSNGFSKEAFAGHIGVSRKTLYEWVKEKPEFSEAMEIAEAKSQLWWEGAGMTAINGMNEKFNSTVWIFSMKNRFGWRDRQELTGKDGEPIGHKIEVVITNLSKK